MKSKLIRVCAIVCALCIGFVLAGCSNDDAYEPAELSPVVDTPTILESGVLTVGLNADNAPFTGTSNGKLVGLYVDSAYALADQMGLTVKFVDVGADGGLDALNSGTVDIVFGMDASVVDETVWLSDSVAETGVTLFAAPDNATAPAADSAPMIAAQVSSKSAWAVENVFGSSSVVAASNLESAFSSLETGDAAYVAADGVIGSYAAKDFKVEVVPVAVLEQPTAQCIAVLASNQDLVDAVTAAVASVNDGGILDLVAKKWLGSPVDLASLPLIEGTAAPAETAEEGGEAAIDEEGAATEEGAGSEEGAAAEEGSVEADLSDSLDSDTSSAGANAVLPSGGTAADAGLA
ncbi:cystine transporter subunit [Slackia heliotrinireducens]|uniref:substrate-binding periplasmic protein n=1 Tax=Slackia heliotrinireducens TaxID=84110 RepID=UPI0001A35327|nr:transporter substrate-binding domain-containing protein [Slackia heliotrinireducens]VEH01017.1 cystine transporter subunit [Slackia heliotrinireducens]